MKVGLVTTSPIHLRMRRVISAHPRVQSVVHTETVEGFDLLISDRPLDSSVPTLYQPAHPLGWLLGEVSKLVSNPTLRAYTPFGEPLRRGLPVQFPPPLGGLWGEERDGVLIAPTNAGLAGVVAHGTTTVGVTDDRAFLVAIAAMGPALAELSETSPIEAMQAAGLGLATS